MAFAQNQRNEVRDLGDQAGALAAEPGMRQQTFIASMIASTSSQADSPAKTSQSRDDAEDSQAPDPACSSSSQGSPMSLFGQEDGSSLRTSPAFSLPTADGTWESWSQRWPTSGFLTSPTEFWTADTSECPNGGGASSSLPDVLEADVHPRFSLSPKAAAGILRRAEKRGRELPPALAKALRELASQHPDDGKRTTRTSPEPSKPRTEGGESMLREPRPGTSSPAAASPLPSDGTGRLRPSSPEPSVRRLTPTECERLQGLPDGWTLAPSTRVPMAPATQPAAMPSPPPSPNGSDVG